MPDYPSTPISEVKQRLINGMIEYMGGDPDESDDDFDCGYTQEDVDRCSAIIDAFLDSLDVHANEIAEPEIILAIKDVVLQLNELNEKCGHSLIETDQREDLCEIILMAAKQIGLTMTDDVTEEWREW